MDTLTNKDTWNWFSLDYKILYNGKILSWRCLYQSKLLIFKIIIRKWKKKFLYWPRPQYLTLLSHLAVPVQASYEWVFYKRSVYSGRYDQIGPKNWTCWFFFKTGYTHERKVQTYSVKSHVLYNGKVLLVKCFKKIHSLIKENFLKGL